MREALSAMIEKHEGRRQRVYFDSEGIETIGVGYNLKRHDARKDIETVGADYERILSGEDVLTDEQIDKLLDSDIGTAIGDALSFVGSETFDALNTHRQVVLVDMAFNLGARRLGGFKNFRAALVRGDFERAADEMRESRWYNQVGIRAVNNTNAMRYGEIAYEDIREIIENSTSPGLII